MINMNRVNQTHQGKVINKKEVTKNPTNNKSTPTPKRAEDLANNPTNARIAPPIESIGNPMLYFY